MKLRTRAPRGALAIGVLFLINAAMWTSIGPRLADIAEDLGVGEGALGLALSLQAIGLLAAMLIGPWLVRRVGVKPMAVASAVVYCLATTLPGLASTLGMLAAACLVSGVANGPFDLGMNRMATDLEGTSGRALMARFEVFFNVGALGAVLLATWLADHLSVRQHLTAVGFAGAVAILVVSHWLPSAEPDAAAPPLRVLLRTMVPGERRRMTMLAAVAAVGLWAELMIPDWSSLLFAQRFGAEGSERGWGAVAFVAGLLLSLMVTDRLAERFRRRPIVLAGALLFLAGMTALPFAPSIGVACGLLALAGIGIAPTHPLAISASGAMASRDIAQPVVMMAGYIGLSVQRPVNGALAEWLGLSAALTISAVLVGVVVLACVSGYNDRRAPARG